MRIHQTRNIHISGFFLLIAFGFVTCQNQEDRASAVIVKSETGNILDKTLTPFCQSLVSDFDLPGMAVGVVKDNEIVYAKGFGYENIHTKEPVTIASLFHMASISKPFVATAIMQLVEQDKMHLDSALITYLPYFKINAVKNTSKRVYNCRIGLCSSIAGNRSFGKDLRYAHKDYAIHHRHCRNGNCLCRGRHHRI